MCLTNAAMYGWKALPKVGNDYKLINGILPASGKWIKKQLGRDSYGRKRLKTLPLAWDSNFHRPGGRYPVGFHVFLYKKDAVQYGNARKHQRDIRLVRVAIKGLLFIGTQKTTWQGMQKYGKTIICEEIAFLGEEPMVE